MPRPYKSYSGDPRWISAKYDSKDANGREVKRGQRVLYFPATRKIYSGTEAETEWSSFQSAAADEAFETGSYC